MKGTFLFLYTNYSHIINIWYVGFILPSCYGMFSTPWKAKNDSTVQFLV
jgi:hypothetical protein